MKTRVDLIDQDYIHKLSDKELDWLDKFNREYVNDTLDRENPKNNLHKTKRLKKDCDDRNNSRNRDILTRAKASNQLTDYEDLHEEASINNYEDYIVEELDKKDAIEAVTWLADALGKDENNLEDRLIYEAKEAVKSAPKK